MSRSVIAWRPCKIARMGRWEPDAAGRLRGAAIELFAERGYEGTTVAEIAERAGVTARTFFRHYADKREVLFAGSGRLFEHIARAARAAPPSSSPIEVVGTALDAAADVLGGDRRYSRLRQQVIAANPELRERELVKLAAMAETLARVLHERGVPEPDAALAAEAGSAAMRVAFERWAGEPRERALGTVMRETLHRLRTVVASDGTCRS